MNLGALSPTTSAVLEDRVEVELEVGKVAAWVGGGGVPAWAFLAATAARNGDRRTPELLKEELCGKASLGLLLMDSAAGGGCCCCCRGIEADDDIAPKGDEDEDALCVGAGEGDDAAAVADE